MSDDREQARTELAETCMSCGALADRLLPFTDPKWRLCRTCFETPDVLTPDMRRAMSGQEKP